MLRNIQHTSGNQSLRARLGLADKYTNLFPLAWRIKPVSTCKFFRTKQLFAEFSLVSDFFRSKKLGSNPTFYCFQAKKVASYEKIRKWKTNVKIKYGDKNFCEFYPNIHRIPHLTLKLRNDAERTFK